MINPGRRSQASVTARWLAAAPVLLLALPQVLFAGDLAVNALWPGCRELGPLSWLEWFDPTLVVYNLVLATLAVTTVPGITYFYVRYRKKEKLRRLRNDLNDERWKQNETAIKQYVSDQFRLRNYWGSLATLTLVVLLGASIILMLKPVPSQNATFGCGVDYGIGANMLLLGPYLEGFAKDPAEYYHHVIVSLTAFQFGFLGAYVYMIGDLVRSYFTLDLSPRTFVASSIRIMTGSLLALVLSFVIAHPIRELDSSLPVVAFFLGHFPESGLVFLKSFVAKKLGIVMDRAKTISLSNLPGMSYAHETRLVREGYDNVENLATARPLDLVMATGFSYRQIRQWIAQAWLCAHLGEEHYADFCSATGLSSADELALFIDPARQLNADPLAHLTAATGSRYAHKVAVLCALVGAWQERMDRTFVA